MVFDFLSGLYVVGVDQLDVVPHLAEHAQPIVYTGIGFHNHFTGILTRQQLRELFVRNRPVKNDSTSDVCSANLKNIFGQIKTNSGGRFRPRLAPDD